MELTWQQSVDRARRGNMKAIGGRFEIALASFEQFGPDHGGRRTAGEKTLLDFADEVGIAYHTLTGYRSVVLWWFEGAVRVGAAPQNIAWDALKWAKSRWPLSSDLRALLRHRIPRNRKLFTTEELEVMFREDVPARQRRSIRSLEAFDAAMDNLRRLGDRMGRTARAIEDVEFDDDQREQLREAALRTREAVEQILERVDARVVA